MFVLILHFAIYELTPLTLLPNNKTFDWSKLKAFGEDNMNQMIIGL